MRLGEARSRTQSYSAKKSQSRIVGTQGLGQAGVERRQKNVRQALDEMLSDGFLFFLRL